VSVRETEARTILRKNTKIDSWFVSRLNMNLYRGCLHDCSYCDGRAEGYYVEGEFGRDVEVKVNAPGLLARELSPAGKRKPFPGGYVLVGGGVCDGYQPAEREYGLTRSALSLLLEYGHAASILTKSTLALRDLDLVREIHAKKGALFSMSFSSFRDDVSRTFEPGVPKPSERLDALKRFKDAGVPCGIFLMPVIPFVTDTEECMEEVLSGAAAAGIDFVLFGGMTLKEGRQKDHFLSVLRGAYPGLEPRINAVYPGNPYGAATGAYYDKISRLFHSLARKHGLPVRIPQRLFGPLLDRNDTVIVLLEQIDYLLKLEGKPSSFGYAAYNLSRLKGTVADTRDSLKKVRGVNPLVEKTVLEILDTGCSALYGRLMGP
jgi:DNA repair photolyase